MAQQGLNTLREIAVDGKVSNFPIGFAQIVFNLLAVINWKNQPLMLRKKFLDNKKKQVEKLLVDYIFKYPEGSNSSR